VLFLLLLRLLLLCQQDIKSLLLFGSRTLMILMIDRFFSQWRNIDISPLGFVAQNNCQVWIFAIIPDKKKAFILGIYCRLALKISAKKTIDLYIDKLKLAGQNLVQVFNFRHVRLFVQCISFRVTKLPSLKWKPRHNELLPYLPIALSLPDLLQYKSCLHIMITL
jgi:hypothetical protein